MSKHFIYTSKVQAPTQEPFTLLGWAKLFLCSCLWLLLSACERVPESSFTEQLWQLHHSQQTAFNIGDVLLFKGDSVHIRNKFTGQRQQLAWRTAPSTGDVDSLLYLVPSYESQAGDRWSVVCYKGDSLVAKLDSLVPAFATDTMSRQCLEKDATHELAMGGQYIHLVTVTPPGEAEILHILASDTAFELSAQRAMNYSMTPMLGIDEEGNLRISFFEQKGSKGITLIDYYCQCEQADRQGNLTMACLSLPLIKSLPNSLAAKVDSFYLQKLAPLIPLEVGEGSILERINTGRLVIAEGIGSISAEEASALSRLKLRVTRGAFCGYSSLENPLHSPAMRGNLRLD